MYDELFGINGEMKHQKWILKFIRTIIRDTDFWKKFDRSKKHGRIRDGQIFKQMQYPF